MTSATKLESLLTHLKKEELVLYVDRHPESIQELIALSLEDKPPYSWRAAWLLESCLEQGDQKIEAHSSDFVKVLPLVSEQQQRCLLRLIQQLNLKETDISLLTDECIHIWKHTEHHAALRLNAMKCLLQVMETYPELKHEIAFLTEPHYMEGLTHGIRHSLNILLAKAGF